MLNKIFFVFAAIMLLNVGSLGQATASTAADSPTTVKKPAVFRPTKDQIKQVQGMLVAKKMYSGEASGTYNDPTRDGIKRFQKDNGLKETGTLNRATLEKFGVELTASQKLIPVSDSSFAETEKSETAAKTPAKITTASTAATGDKLKKPAPFRATSDQIKAAQKMMKDKAMYAGSETGKLDDSTREGLKKFQESAGIKVTGTLNALTLEKMGIELTEKQKADAAMTANK